MPFIINNLNQWDREFHNEVCSLIESPKVIEVMPEHDAEQFLRRFVAILNAVNAKLYLSFARRVLRVCGILIKKTSFSQTTSVCLTTIKQFINSRNGPEERAIGFDLLYSIAEVHRNDFFGKSTTLLTLYQKMTNDSNWCLRKRFIANALDFLEPTTSSSTQSIFDTFFEKPILMGLQDDNLNVAFEALKVVNEYPHLFDPELYEEMYKPLVAKLLKKVQKGSSEPTLRIEFSRVQGRILDLLKKNRLLDPTLARSFFLFFKSCISEDDPVTEGFTTETDEDLDYAYFSRRPQELQSLMVNAMYNLPCFYLHLDGGGVSDINGQGPQVNEAVASKQQNKQGQAYQKQATKINQAASHDYQEDLLTLAQKVSCPDQTDIRAKEIMIKCFHELLAIKTNKSYQTKLLLILEDLITSSSEKQAFQLQTTLCQHLGDIIGSFTARPEHAALTRQFFSLRNQNLKKCKAEFFLQDLCIKLNLKPPISPAATKNTKDTAAAQKEFAYPPSLAKFIQLECIHEEFSTHELASHRLLELIAKLFKQMINTPQRSYKNIATLLSAVSFNIKYFNAAALDNFFSQKLLDYLENAPECIVPELLQFLLRLIHVQYREGLKDSLLQTLIDKLILGNAKARIRFINLCEFAVEILDLATFAAHFMPLLETGFSQEKTPSVIKAYLYGFLTIWETLSDVGSDELVLQFNECLKQQRLFPEELRTLAVDVRTKVRLCIEKAEKEPSLTEQRRENAKNLIDRETAVRDRLSARYTYETEVAGFVQKEQENKKLLNLCQSINLQKPVSKGSGSLPNIPQPRKSNTEKSNVWYGLGTAPPKTKPAPAEQKKPIANQTQRSGKELNQISKSPSTTKTTPGPASIITSGRFTPKLELKPIEEDSASPETSSILQHKVLQEKCIDTCSSAAFYSLPIEKESANHKDLNSDLEKIEKQSLAEQELRVCSIAEPEVSSKYILEVRTPFEESEDSIVEANQAMPETLRGTPIEEQRVEHNTLNEEIPDFNFVNSKPPKEQQTRQDTAMDEQASTQEVAPNHRVVRFNTRKEKIDSTHSKGLLSTETLECFIINQRKAIEKQASNIVLWSQETRNTDLKNATPQPMISPQNLVLESTTMPVRTPGRLESIYLKNHKAQLQALKTLRKIQTIGHSTASSGSINLPKGSSSAYRQMCSRLSCSSLQQIARVEHNYPHTARDKDLSIPLVQPQLSICNADAQMDQQAFRRAGFVGHKRQNLKLKASRKLITSPSQEQVNENTKTPESDRDNPREPHTLIVELTTRGLFTERKERKEHANQHRQKVPELISLSPFASQFANGAENPRVVPEQSPHSQNAFNEGYQSVEFHQSTNPLLSYRSPLSDYKKYKKNMSLRELCEVAKYCSAQRKLSIKNLRLEGHELRPNKANAKQQVHLSQRNLKTTPIDDLKTKIKNERQTSQLTVRYKSNNFEDRSLSQEMLSLKIELIDKLKQPKGPQIPPPRNIQVLQLLRRKKQGPKQVLYEKVGKRLKLQPVTMVVPGSFVERQLENNMLLKSQRLDQGRSSRLEQLVAPEMVERVTNSRNELQVQDILTHRRLICN